MERIEKYKVFDKLPIKCYVYFSDLDLKKINIRPNIGDPETVIGCCDKNVVIIYNHNFDRLPKKFQDFVIQHEIGHIRQFYLTLGLSVIINKFKKIYNFFEWDANRFASKKTGMNCEEAMFGINYILNSFQ